MRGAGMLLLAACEQPTPSRQPDSPRTGSSSTAPAPPGGSPATRAPAPAASAPSLRGTTISVLLAQSFVKGADALFADLVKRDFEQQSGVMVNLETVDFNQLQLKIAAAIQSGKGVDLVQLFDLWPMTFADSLADVSDVAALVEKTWGGFYPQTKSSAQLRGSYIAVPHGIVGNSIVFRECWLKDVGYEKFPDDWTQFSDCARKLRARGRPVGQSLGHSVGEPAAWAYPLLWSFGGKEVEQDSRSVAINSRETIESVKWMVQAWKEGFEEAGVGWDDASNNRAFLGQKISATLNGPAIFWAARGEGLPIWRDINHAPMPKGPAGRYHWHQTFSMGLLKQSTNQEAAREFIRWMMSEHAFEPWFRLQEGYVLPPGPKFENHPAWTTGPKALQPFRDVARYGRWPGFEGAASQASSNALGRYVVVDMYARAVLGEAPEAAVKWAEGEQQQIYSKA